MTIGEHTFKTLQIAGHFFPVPSVARAASLALSILQEAQTVKVNKEEFATIGRDSCSIVEAIIHKVQVNDPVTLQQVDMLVVNLQYIEKCIEKTKGRSRMRKIFSHQLDRIMIQDCREHLTGAMALFGLQDNTEIRKQLASMHNLLFTLLEALSRPPSPRTQSQPHWQIPSTSFPPTPSPQTQEPSAPAIQRDFSSDISTPTLVLAPTASPLRSHRLQERAERQTGWGHPPSSNPTGSPSRPEFRSLQNTHNDLPFPGAGIGYSYVAGGVNNTTRNDSFNVFGTGNSIYFSLGR